MIATVDSGYEAVVGRSALEGLSTGLLGALAVLAVGFLFVRFGREYTRTVTDRALYDPIGAFAWGVALTLGAISGILVLGLLGPGVLALPIVLLFLPLSFVATVLGYLAVGRYVTDGWGRSVVVGTVVAAIAFGTPLVGTAIGFAVSSVGIGAVVQCYRNEFDREFQRALAGPGAMRSRIGVSTEDGTVTRFLVALEYWNGSEWRDVVDLHRDSERAAQSGSGTGLSADVRRSSGVAVEPVGDPRSDDALERALSSLEANLERVVREFESCEGIDESTAETEYEAPLTDAELGRARDELEAQREAVRAYLESV